MMKRLLILLNTSLLLALVMVLSGCSIGQTREYPKHGYRNNPWIPGTEGQKEVRVQVLDASTMQPVSGAIVVGGYYGLGPTGWGCAFSESATTDESGWATLPNDQDERIRSPRHPRFGPWLKSAYKRGYQDLFPLKTVGYRIEDDKENWYVYETVIDHALPNAPGPVPDRGSLSGYREQDIFQANSKRIQLPEKYPDQKSALLASKERSTIYLYPSTAKTKEERGKELNQIKNGSCLALPFKFSSSDGDLLLLKAIYQEMSESGFPKDDPKYIEIQYVIDYKQKSLQRQREEAARGE